MIAERPHGADISIAPDGSTLECAAVALAELPTYEPGAFRPADMWSELNSNDYESVGPESATTIEVVRCAEMFSEVLDAVATGADDALSALIEQASEPWIATAEAPPLLLGLSWKEGGMATTSTLPGNGNRVGLHIDNFDRLPLLTRAGSRRRVLVNLGPGDRYFLIGTASIFQVADFLTLESDVIPGVRDLRHYLKRGGEMRCLRLRLRPGDGYIAPTETVPHDGSTLGSELPSLTAHWLGTWEVGTLHDGAAAG
jgi:hypothetical protein